MHTWRRLFGAAIESRLSRAGPRLLLCAVERILLPSVRVRAAEVALQHGDARGRGRHEFPGLPLLLRLLLRLLWCLLSLGLLLSTQRLGLHLRHVRLLRKRLLPRGHAVRVYAL